jgi:hypothetical protein
MSASVARAVTEARKLAQMPSPSPPRRAPVRLRVLVVGLIAIALGGCLVRNVPPEMLARMRKAFDEQAIENEPLCIKAGPFPFRGGARKGNCDRCQELAAAGFLTQRIAGETDGGYVEYTLSPAGAAIYRKAPDPEYLDIVRARFAAQGRGGEEPDAEALEQPRLCFGRTRFHEVVDSLAPFTFSGTVSTSVKLVAIAEDSEGVLFDPQVATLGLPLPPRPKPGEPALYPPRVVNFEAIRGEDALEITSLRYGAWVDEP